ncbi:hypothetical protein A6A03_01710 [Chloroflexus islandicus]|uniref:Glycosyltransferase n=1 Tax=Chloroflexus islandicus TaxID=1707952 RepID=A0A178MD88_9CHLR|nr:hypothetical protein A6A03_01710 [Chloroflexus islandicus]
MHRRRRFHLNRGDRRAVSALPVLVMMARRPEAGRVKTRLCPPLTPAQAATLYAAFLRDLVDLVRVVPGVQPLIAYAPAEAGDYFAALAPAIARRPQTGADLGERLAAVTDAVLGEGAPAVLVIGSDSPSLPPAQITQAVAALAGGADLVLGPAEDGGYYLVGLRRPAPALFTEVPMSTPTVLRDTLAVAERLGLRTALIDPWYDIDTIADLHRLRADPAPLRHTRPVLAAVLASLAEER